MKNDACENGGLGIQFRMFGGQNLKGMVPFLKDVVVRSGCYVEGLGVGVEEAC